MIMKRYSLVKASTTAVRGQPLQIHKGFGLLLSPAPDVSDTVTLS